MKSKSKLSLLRRKSITKMIGDQAFEFHRITLAMLFELRTIGEPLLSALRSIFDKEIDLTTQTIEKSADGSSITHFSAPDPKLVEMRAAARDAKQKAALDAVFGEQSRELLVRVIADSLREDPADIRDEVMDLDIGNLVEFVKALLEVNAEVFGPFVQRFRDAAMKKLNGLGQAQAEAASSEPASDQSQPPQS